MCVYNFFFSCVWVGIEKGLNHASEGTTLQKFGYNSKSVSNLKKLVRDKIVDHDQANKQSGNFGQIRLQERENQIFP